ncbi:hypothetical protein WA158_002285 [Blastocystis sp. Blastoise]
MFPIMNQIGSMKSLVFILLLSSAISLSCPDQYYADEGMFSCSYCNGEVIQHTHSSACRKCESGTMYINGNCIPTDSMCSNGIPYGQSIKDANCDDGYFGVITKSCFKSGSSWIGKTYVDGCFSKAKSNGGIPLGYVGVDWVIKMTGIEASLIDAKTRVSIIYSLVSVFPFAIGDVYVGAVETISSPGEEPVILVYIRIITLHEYVYYFQRGDMNDLENSESASYQITHYLMMNFGTIFHSEFTFSFFYIENTENKVECSIPVDDLPLDYNPNNHYYLNDIIYYPCERIGNIDYIGYITRKCSIQNGISYWSTKNYAGCSESHHGNSNSKYRYLDFRVQMKRVNYAYINCNITLEFYPLFVELASTRLADINVYSFTPYVSEDNKSSTQFFVRYITKKNIKRYETDTNEAMDVLFNQLFANISTLRDTESEIFNKLNDLDETRFHSGIEVSINNILLDGDQIQISTK